MSSRIPRRAPRAPLLAFLAAALVACASNDPSTAPLPAGSDAAVTAIRTAAHPIRGAATDYDPLLALVGDARVVLLGESTHGTHEFYRERARITQRLIAERGFTAVAIEGDWGETLRVNEYVRGLGADRSAEQALSGFTDFPQWMWRNAEVRDLVQWIRARNDAQPVTGDVGFYGLDIQSLAPPMDALLGYLTSTDPAAAERARSRLACLTAHGGDPQRYGAAVARSASASCQASVAELASEMRQRAAARPADPVQAELLFGAARSAQAIASGEEYFRVSYTGTANTWNLRDRRMAENLEAIETHLAATTGRPAKVVVWAHNTHTGDARATESGEQGELNIGQLSRERLGAAAVNVGFLTYVGSVFAAPEWGATGRVFDLRPALPESYAALLHGAATSGGPRDFLLVLRGQSQAATALAQPRLERAVGVIYVPQTERQSHYFGARLAQQFDAVVYVDSSRALQPLAP
jgi:erythromycin esterase-like protein